MTTFRRVSMVLAVLAVVVCAGVVVNHRLERSYAVDREADLAHKRLQHALATVDRVERAADQTTVCFTLDSLAELPAGDRSFYETTEALHAAGHGPRCAAAHTAAASALNAGAKLDVYFTLENGGKIAIARVEASGHEI